MKFKDYKYYSSTKKIGNKKFFGFPRTAEKTFVGKSDLTQHGIFMSICTHGNRNDDFSDAKIPVSRSGDLVGFLLFIWCSGI